MKNKLILTLLAIPVLLLFTACGTNGPSANPGKQQSKEVGEADYEQMITPNNELGIHLLSKVDADDDSNLFISPTSLFMALSMIYNGAEGDTKREIGRALQMEGIDAETLNRANASLMNNLQKESKSIQVAIANSMWLNDSFRFQDEFAANNQEYFNAEIEEINIHDDKSAKKINDWVKKSTNDKITKMVDSPLNPNMVAYLLNAIYFKGDWTYPFDKEATENKPFYLKDGTTKDVSLMTLNEELSYMENDRFQAVKLPYGDGEMSMRVFLPKEDTTIDEFQNKLTLENWEAWNDSFEVTQGVLKFPKFQLDYEVLLNDALKQLGMKLAFSDQADFSKIIQEDESLWISLVKQKTYIEVDEEGTEAAAVTGVEVVMESLPVNEPFTMEVNRPFFIAIIDDETGAIVFMGIVSNPQSK